MSVPITGIHPTTPLNMGIGGAGWASVVGLGHNPALMPTTVPGSFPKPPFGPIGNNYQLRQNHNLQGLDLAVSPTQSTIVSDYIGDTYNVVPRKPDPQHMNGIPSGNIQTPDTSQLSPDQLSLYNSRKSILEDEMRTIGKIGQCLHNSAGILMNSAKMNGSLRDKVGKDSDGTSDILNELLGK